MIIHHLGKSNSIINQYVAELRDVDIQTESWRFRRNVERISELMAYEISKTLEYEEKEVSTPLGIANVPMLTQKLVIASVLRAGLCMQNGILNIFDKAENAFVAAYRKYGKDEGFKIQLEYVTCPDLSNKILIVADPMLATGASIVEAWNALRQYGDPIHTYFVSIISAEEGVQYIQRFIPADRASIWVAAIDQELTARAYIVPGLGDVGDLAFGDKLQS